jgi:serine/threonine-protein kinase HipA
VTRWEATTLAMADAARIEVPAHRLATVLAKPVLVVQRFDRRGKRRVPYISALTALAARDGELRSYIELADVLRANGASVAKDLAQLWRRIVFNILVSNTDDHLRNHGFLREPQGWRLSPAFDLNPMPVDVRPRVHALAIDELDPAASIERVQAIVPSFGITTANARKIIRDVARVTAKWRTFAADHGITKRQIERMETAFEHADLELASSL